MQELVKIFKYRLLWLNSLLIIIFVVISFFTLEASAFLFVLVSNLYDILGYHFSLIRRSKEMPEKIIIRSYRINQFLFDLILLLLIGIQFDWIAAFAGWILKEFGLQDVFYYLFLKEKLPEKWNWMKWTPLGLFKGDLTKNEIVLQSIVGIIFSIILLILR
jgi:hypothetical protein